MNKRVTVGRVSGYPLSAKHSGLGRQVKARRFATVGEAEAFVGRLEKLCATQVHAGKFFIDVPEEGQGSCKRCASPLTGTYDAGNPANSRGPGYCSDQTCPHNDYLQHETWTDD